MDGSTLGQNPKREERDSPASSIALFPAEPTAPSDLFSSPTFTSRETGTASLRKILYYCATVHSLLPIKMLWM